MTKDLKNKLNTFMILLFACVLLLGVSLFSDYEISPSKQMDNDAAKIVQMEALNSKQAAILIQMDTIETRINAYDPTANNAVVLSNEIDKAIKELKDFFVKNSLGQSAFKGITDNYQILLRDKSAVKTTNENISKSKKKLEDCKDKTKDLKQSSLILKISGNNSKDK